MQEIQKIIEGQEEIVSYFQAITSTNCFEQKARNALELLKKQEARIRELEEKLRALKYGDQDTLESAMMQAT